MGMPCEVNSILKLKLSQGYPDQLKKGQRYSAQKESYRIIPMDVPILLVDEDWFAYADIKICRLVWENSTFLFGERQARGLKPLFSEEKPVLI